MNPKLRNTTTRKLIRALEADGFTYVRSRGSHRVYRHTDGRRVIVAYHRPGATFPPKTLASMITGARWSEEDLRRLDLLS
jgi:predicted RNA binding protein YcfA (HicA-like mRNA interferase family)